MMNKEINNILVFHDGDTEFATTIAAIAHALEVNQANDEKRPRKEADHHRRSQGFGAA